MKARPARFCPLTPPASSPPAAANRAHNASRQTKCDGPLEIGLFGGRVSSTPYGHEHDTLALPEFGNPFRPVAFSPEWRTSTAVALATQMHESRDFGAMPILADALQDAGCDNDDILNHCRGDGPHVRGCWVVDLVLGK